MNVCCCCLSLDCFTADHCYALYMTLTLIQRTSLPIAVSAIAVPFGTGIGLATWLVQVNNDDKNQAAASAAAQGTHVALNTNDLAFYLFFGTSMSFTAFPVLARILTSARLITSPIGIETLATAAIDDLLAWCTLATVLSYSSGMYTSSHITSPHAGDQLYLPLHMIQAGCIPMMYSY
jgi:Kef-type K+ transport system membrane component KefB